MEVEEYYHVKVKVENPRALKLVSGTTDLEQALKGVDGYLKMGGVKIESVIKETKF